LQKDLNKVSGVYGFINLKDGKQYIGSSSNLYDRFTDHIKGVSTNIRLKRSIAKYSLDCFNFVIYYFHKDPAVLLTNIETEVIRSFPFEDLYNFKKDAKSSLGYKHTADVIAKMKARFTDKINHPMYGKKHSLESLQDISKPGKLNPMFNKKHKIESKLKFSIALSKTPLGLYDIENNLIKSYKNQVELAAEFKLYRGTICRYLKSGKLFLGKYYIRKLNN
jgi:group I intron endonuclease